MKTRTKNSANINRFQAGDIVVYPRHGVGRISEIETGDIAGATLRLLVIRFDEYRMTLRVPVAKARQTGLRRLSTRKIMDSALKILKSRGRAKRMMWSRRAHEYRTKIDSGDPLSIAEVVRDLHRDSDQPHDGRQIYLTALHRLARELAAVEKLDEKRATDRIESILRHRNSANSRRIRHKTKTHEQQSAEPKTNP